MKNRVLFVVFALIFTLQLAIGASARAELPSDRSTHREPALLIWPTGSSQLNCTPRCKQTFPGPPLPPRRRSRRHSCREWT